MSGDAAWTPGDLVEGHRLVRVLGRGGMGEVWLAEHVATRAARALKVLRGSFASEDLVRFQREVEALARVDGHPNVIRVHAAGVHARCPWVVMERVGGGDLQARLEAGPLAPVEAAALLRDLARGVAHVHAHGVLHRDLKPANVLIDERGAPVLVDFGLARLRGAESLTQTGTTLGTPVYMAPEQARGDQVDERADVYGLGAIFYHTLCGRPPFSGRSPLEVLAKVCEGRPPPPRAARTEVPRELESICLRALALEPGARWPSAAALGGALDEWLARGGRAPGSGGAIVLVGGATAIAVAVALAALSTRPVEPAARGPQVAVVVSDDVAPPATAATASRARGAWARRFDLGEHLQTIERPGEIEHARTLALLDSIDDDLLRPDTRRDALERLTRAAGERDGLAQRRLGEALLATDRRHDALTWLWRASRPDQADVRAGVRLGLELILGPEEHRDLEGASLLLAEAEERCRANPERGALDLVDIACGFVLLRQPDHAVVLLDEAPRKDRIREAIETHVQRPERRPLWPSARFLDGVSSLRGWDRPLDPAAAAAKFNELKTSADESARTAAATWLEELPARRLTWAQRFGRESTREVDRVGFVEWRLAGHDPTRNIGEELASPDRRSRALATLEAGVAKADGMSQRFLGEDLVTAEDPGDHARGLHLLWLASRGPEPEAHAGTSLASQLIHGPTRDLDCALLLLVEADARARDHPAGHGPIFQADLASDLVHPGRDDLALDLLERSPTRAAVATRVASRAAVPGDPLAPCSAVLAGIALLRGWTGPADAPAARARFEALLDSSDASAAAAARRWLDRVR